MRALHRRNGIGWPAHVHSRCGLAPKDVKQELARLTSGSGRRFAWSSRHPLVGSGPLNLEPATLQPPTQEAAAAAYVAPQGGIHCGRQVSGASPVGAADVLVMNKELVEVRESPDPPYAEEADWRAGPNPRDEPGEVIALGQSDSALLGEPLEGAGQDNAGPGNEIAFSQHDVGCEVMSSPALEQGRNGRPELIE
jgi:hypothetical protein